MARTKKRFAEADKIKMLLWCSRHCCLCGEFAGISIELHHIDGGSADIDNAIPVCLECHANIGHYNPKHPKGRKYDPQELKTRRNQVYEEHTKHLVPPVRYRITQELPCSNIARELPNVGFHIKNRGDIYSVRARVWVTIGQGGRLFGHPSTHGHYDGRWFWNLNARAGVSGHFTLPSEASSDSAEALRARIDVWLYDIYEYEHRLLPVGYVYQRIHNNWYFEVCEEALPRAPLRTSMFTRSVSS